MVLSSVCIKVASMIDTVIMGRFSATAEFPDIEGDDMGKPRRRRVGIVV
jgi:hypothetical protein